MLLAKRVGLDSDKIIIHSIRHGTLNQVIAAGFASDAIMVQGGWASEGGAASYLMPTLDHDAMVANAIHNNKSVPVVYLVHAFNSGNDVGGNCQS